MCVQGKWCFGLLEPLLFGKAPGGVKGSGQYMCLYPLYTLAMFKVLIENQFLRGGFHFANWTGAWYRIYAYKFLITRLGDCSVDPYAA